ncbi:MAG TPA: hypothetical protein VKX41_15230 [Alloacidobacterium sp.]|jgi:uncharacterized protein (DUF983 family)|nr:hypothetical protein [Alloacidobacterium sp.]
MWEDVKDFTGFLFEKLQRRSAVEVVNGQPYALREDGTLGAPVRDLAPQWTKPTLEVSTLAGFVAAYQAKMDDRPDKVAIRIVGHRVVELVSQTADDYGRRHVWLRARYVDEVPFKFDSYYEPEKFLIDFRSSFYFNDNAVKVQQLCSTLSAENSVAVADDGMSQVVTVKTGTVVKNTVTLPADGVPLIPWRTFRDAAPVESKFLLRMKSVKDSLPLVALIDIDAKWELDTMGSIKKYLSDALPDAVIIA